MRGVERRKAKNNRENKKNQFTKLLVRLLGPDGGWIPFGRRLNTKGLYLPTTCSTWFCPGRARFGPSCVARTLFGREPPKSLP